VEQRSARFTKLGVGAVLVTALLPGCGPKQPEPSVPECRQEIILQLSTAGKVGGVYDADNPPPGCKGLTNKQLQAITKEILHDEIDPSGTPAS
jgi:hypothetical protein